jgi:hypothetical protein
MKKAALYILLIFLLAVGLRLYPTLLTGTPFSTDAWSPIRNTQLIIQNTPTPITSPVFDGYNNYWPANSLFGAVISQVTGIPPIQAMPLFFPLIGAVAVLILLTITKRLINITVALIAAAIFATAYSHAFFTAAVTKETYASPIYLLLIMLLLHPTLTKNKQILLFAIASTTLALAHHLTALIAILTLTSIAIGNFAHNIKNGVQPQKTDFLLVSIPTATAALCYGLFAQTGMANPLSIPEWMSLGSFQLITFALIIYLAYKPPITKVSHFIAIAATAVAASLIYIILSLTTILIPSFTISIQESATLYAIPYFIALPFIALGLENHRSKPGKIAVLFWIAPLAALEAFAIFSNTAAGLGLWIRTANFICVPAAILAATGLYWMYQKTKGINMQKLAKTTIAAILVAITAIGIFTMYATVSLQDPNMGYQWVYTQQEYKAGTWLNQTIQNQTITGDVKTAYLMRDYFNAKTDVTAGFKYLNNDTQTQPQILFTYAQMQKNGYVLGLQGIQLPQNWTQKTNRMNKIYTNNIATIYTGTNQP